MNDDEFDNYRKSRYLAQQTWYSSRARQNRKKYLMWQALLLASSVATTVLIGLQEVSAREEILKVSALIASAFTMLSASVLKAFKYEENWINYRQTSEALKKEQYYFTASLDVYQSAANPRATFVSRVESLISRESDRWVVVASSNAGAPVIPQASPH